MSRTLSEPEVLAVRAAEVAVLLRVLPAALARDAQGPSAVSERPAGGGVSPAAPVNLAVQEALAGLHVEVPQLYARVCSQLRLFRRAAGLEGMVLMLAGQGYARLVHLAGSGSRLPVDERDRVAGLAADVDRAVWRWWRDCRKAVGLKRPAHPFPSRFCCPYGCMSDDEDGHRVRTVLLVDGDEATLDEGLLAARRRRPGEPAWRWRSTDTVFCPQCRIRWTGLSQLRLLGRLLQEPASG